MNRNRELGTMDGVDFGSCRFAVCVSDMPTATTVVLPWSPDDDEPGAPFFLQSASRDTI